MNIFEIRIQRQCESGWLVVVTQTSTDNFLPIRNESILNLPSDYSIQLRRLQTQPKAYGTLLGEAVFQDQIRDAFVNALSNSENGLRVLLNVEDKELKSKIAWQQLCAPIGGNWDFLALNQRVPLSLYLPSNTNINFPPIGKRDLNALILVASPQDLDQYRLHPFDVEETVSSLKKALGNIPTDVLANIANSVGKPTLKAFCRQLTSKRYTLVHIVCHGQFSHSGETILYWADQNHQAAPISATNLLEQLKRQHKGLPYFTFLSTCESAVPAAEMALGGLAQRMVEELGMPAVIAMTQKISIKTAAFLSTEFYQRLRDRGEVDVALVEATAAFAERFDILVPALFSRLRGQRLFCEVLDRNLSNTEIEYGLSRLPELLEVRSPISMKRLFPRLNSTLQKTLKTDPQALSTTLTLERQNALTELNSLCDRVVEISFNALALDQTPPVYDHRCPFQGLYSFRYENREFFFGRERLIEELKQKLAHEHFLAVVGRSGCGKSSLVLAGLVPALQEEQPELQLVDITPGQNPLEQLLAGLSSIPNQLFIIVVDQFEELFTLCTDQLKRVQFIEKLIELSQTQTVVITLREDFLTECAVYPELGQRLETRFKIVTPMQPEELRSAMEQQAAQVGLQFEASASAAIFRDVRDEPGAMPLLQHALRELWRRRHGRWLLYEEYEEIGTVKEAIARTADEFYYRLSPQEQQQVKDIFLRLTRLDDSTATYQERLDTRRRVEMEDLVPLGGEMAVTKDLVRRLANEDARLVVTSRNSVTGLEEVEVAHEALIRHWSKLQEWLNSDRTDLQFRERIRQQAEDWQQEAKDEFLLLQGGRLEDAEGLLCDKPQFFNQQEAEYIKACSRKQRQEVKKLRKWVAALAAAFVVATGAGVLALRQATIANLRLDAARVEDLLESDPVEALILAIKATGESRRKLRYVLPEVQASLYAAIDVPVETNVFKGNGQPINSIAVSPDGTKIVSGSNDGLIRLWNFQGQLIIPPFQGDKSGIWSISFSPDGTKIVSGGDDGKVRLWNLQGDLLAPPFQSHQGYIWSVAFSSDGTKIVSGGDDGKVRLWNLQGNLLLPPFQSHPGDIYSVGFSLDNDLIVSGGSDGKIRLWNLQGKLVNQSDLNFVSEVWSIAFNPNGKTFVSGSSDGKIRLWNLQGKLLSESSQSHKSPIYSVAFNPDGTKIVSGSRDEKVRLWDLQGNMIKHTMQGHKRDVLSVAFSLDGETILSSSFDGTVRLWNLKTNLIREQEQQGKEFTSVAFSPDSQKIATGHKDQIVRLWNTEGELLQTFRDHSSEVTSVAFSPDGYKIVSGSEDNTLRLWSIKGESLSPVFKGHTSEVTSVAFSPDSQKIVSGSWDKRILLWNTQGKLVTQPFQGHEDMITSVAFSPDGNLIVSGSLDKTVRLWKANGRCINIFHIDDSPVQSVAFDQTGKRIVVATERNSIHLLNLEDQSKSNSTLFKGHKRSVRSVEFSPDYKMILSGSRDKTFQLWDLNGNLIGRQSYLYPFELVTFSPDGKMIASISSNGGMQLWHGGDWKEWLQTACHKLKTHSMFIELPNTNTKIASETCKRYIINFKKNKDIF